MRCDASAPRRLHALRLWAPRLYPFACKVSCTCIVAPIGCPQGLGDYLSTQSWLSPRSGAAFQAYSSVRGPGPGRPGEVSCFPLAGNPSPSVRTVRALVVSPLWLKPEPFILAQAFGLNRPKPESVTCQHRLKPHQSGILLQWDEPEPNRLATTHKRENHSKRAPAARCIVCAADSRKHRHG